MVECNQPLTEPAFPATDQPVTVRVLLPVTAAFCSITVTVPLPFSSTLDAVTTEA